MNAGYTCFMRANTSLPAVVQLNSFMHTQKNAK